MPFKRNVCEANAHKKRVDETRKRVNDIISRLQPMADRRRFGWAAYR